MATVSIPRLRICVPRGATELSIAYAVQRLGYDRATREQSIAVCEFLLGRDVFVCLPTGEGKSLCFACLPWAFDWLREQYAVGSSDDSSQSIVVIVSPLIALMKDQVENFSNRGLNCTFVGLEQHDDAVKSDVISGKYALVYISPESLLNVLQWREMFRSTVYLKGLVGIAVDEAHLVEKWGDSFREEFAHLSEARSIISKDVNVMALTATASLHTRNAVLTSLCMESRDPLVLCKVPNKLNIRYSVVTKPEQTLDMLMPLIDDVKRNGVFARKTLIFCRTYQECIDIFIELTTELDKESAMFVPSLSSSGQEHVCQLYTACTAEDTKDHILKSFTSPNGAIRIVVATIAFGLGLDAPNIRQTFHWGPSSDIEAYVQETGRSGCDGLPSTAVLFVSVSEQQHKDAAAATHMQAYCANKSTCRRKVLMSEFTTEVVERPIPLHNCCDICMSECCCETCEYTRSLSLQPRDIQEMEMEMTFSDQEVQ